MKQKRKSDWPETVDSFPAENSYKGLGPKELLAKRDSHLKAVKESIQEGKEYRAYGHGRKLHRVYSAAVDE
jgi:hypothetical protein